MTARIVETGRYGNHRPVFRARLETHEGESRLVGHIGWGMLNLQSLVFTALPIIGLWGIASMTSIALDRNGLLDWVFVLVFIGVTAMFGYLAWISGIERLLPASRAAEIEDLDDALRRALGTRRY